MKHAVVLFLVILMIALMTLHYGKKPEFEPREVEIESVENLVAEESHRVSGGSSINGGANRYPPLLDHLPENRVLYDVEGRGDLFFASTSVGVQIYEIDAEGVPGFQGELSRSGYVHWYVGVMSDTFVVTIGDPIDPASEDNGSSLVTTFDIQDPSNPLELGSIGIPGAVIDGVLSENLLYVTILDETGTESGIHVVSVLDPETPVRLSLLPMGGAETIVQDGDHIYVSGEERPVSWDPDYFLRSVSVTNPLSLTVEDTIYLADNVSDLSAAGSHLYIASDALRVVSVMTPTEMAQVSSRAFITDVIAVDVYSDTAYLAFNVRDAMSLEETRTISAIEVSDPSDLSNLTATFSGPGGVGGLSVADDVLLAATDDDIVLHDALSPGLIQLSDPYATRGWFEDALVIGDYAYAVDRFHGLQTVFLGGGSEAQISSTLSVSVTSESTHLAANGDHLYVVSEYGIATIDIGDPVAPIEVGFDDVVDYSPVGTLASPRDAYVDSNVLYVVAGNAGVLLFDVAQPASPAVLQVLPPYSSSVSADIEGDVLFVVDETGVVSSTNVLSPSQPIALGVYPSGEQLPVQISVASSKAYLHGFDGRMVTIDVADPAVMTEVAAYVPDEHDVHDVSWVEAAASLAILATRDIGLQVVDINIPSDPVEVSVVSGPGFAVKAHLVGSQATIVAGRRLMILDLSVPASPSVLWEVHVSG